MNKVWIHHPESDAFFVDDEDDFYAVCETNPDISLCHVIGPAEDDTPYSLYKALRNEGWSETAAGQAANNYRLQKEESMDPERRDCPKCGKNLTVIASGELRSHKCVESAPAQEQVQQPSDPNAVTVERVMAAYIQTRDELSALKAQYEEAKLELDHLQEKRKNWIAGQMDAIGTETVKNKGIGTAFFQTKDRASVADRDAFLTYVKDNGAWDLVESRVSAKAVREGLEGGRQVPDGVNYSTYRDLVIRRA